MADSLRVLALGDLHLTEGRRQADQEAVLRGIVRDADRLRPQLTVLLGDLFGHRVPHNSSPWSRNLLVEFVAAMSAHGPVVILAGNHDNPDDLSVFEEIRTRRPVFVFTGPEDAVLTAQGDVRVHIRALPYPRRTTFDAGDRSLQDVVDETMATFAATSPVGAFSLFLGHVQVSGCRVGGGEVLHGKEPVITPEQIKALPVDASILGHIHLSQQMAPRSWYAGSPWPQDFGETDRKGYLVVDIDRDERPFDRFDPVLNGGSPPLGEYIERARPGGGLPWVWPNAVNTDDGRPLTITRIWTHAPPLVTLDWRWGVADGASAPSWLHCEAPILPASHIRARLTVDPEYRDTCPWTAATAAIRAAALSWTEEVIVTTRSNVRAPEIAQADGLDEKLHAMWRAMPTPPPEQARHDAINALWDLEGGDEAAVMASIARELT